MVVTSKTVDCFEAFGDGSRRFLSKAPLDVIELKLKGHNLLKLNKGLMDLRKFFLMEEVWKEGGFAKKRGNRL